MRKRVVAFLTVVSPLLLLAVGLAQAAGSGGHGLNLTLTCSGEGTHLVTGTTETVEHDRRGHKTGTKSSTTDSEESFQSYVTVQINGDHGSIHLSQALIPALNSGGSRGWWPFTHFRVSDESIRGSYKLNFATTPEITINRRNGDFRIKGYEWDFSGTCSKTDPGQHRF